MVPQTHIWPSWTQEKFSIFDRKSQLFDRPITQTERRPNPPLGQKMRENEAFLMISAANGHSSHTSNTQCNTTLPLSQNPGVLASKSTSFSPFWGNPDFVTQGHAAHQTTQTGHLGRRLDPSRPVPGVQKCAERLWGPKYDPMDPSGPLWDLGLTFDFGPKKWVFGPDTKISLSTNFAVFPVFLKENSFSSKSE